MKMEARTLAIGLISLISVGALAQETTDPVAEYETLLRETRGLEAYNDLLRRQISQQSEEVDQIRTAIEQVPELERQLPPLLITMVDGLDEFVDRDIPFLQQERTDRITELYEDIENPDRSDAYKLRRVLEAWAIEMEYGGAYMTEQGTVPIDGQDRNVDFIILGRVGLIFQTSDDDAITGAWDSRSNSWVILGGEHRNSVRQAIRMARNQIAPDLVLLPVIPPQPE